jgi:EmrB/QacA subfamily drug resistance transporter
MSVQDQHLGSKDPDRAGIFDGDRYPWIAMGVVLIGTFMVILDTTIVNVALPQIGLALDRQAGIEWVVTAYLLAVGLAQPPTGWLADRFGRKRLFIVSLGFFVIGSLGAALSPNLGSLVGARVIQGLGGGALMPVGMAMIYELFPPHRRGTALGVWGVAAMAGPAFGPVIGGYLVTNVSWHWLFLINVPIGVVGIIIAAKLLRDTGYSERRRFDGVGLALISAGLVVWLFTFAKADVWGWGSGLAVTLLLIGAVLVTLFVLWERRVDHPAIDVSMFGVPIFSLTLAVIACTVVVQFGILVFLPLELETIRGMTALRVGTMLVPTAIAAAITFPLGGRLTDRIGPRVPVVTGVLLLGVSAWILGHLTLESPTLTIEIALVAQGLGFGLAMMPNSVTGLNALPKRFVAQATAVRQLNVRVAASFGVAVLAGVVSTAMGDSTPSGPGDPGSVAGQAAYNQMFVILSGLAVVAGLLAVFLPGKERNRQIQAERAEEYQPAIPEM